MDKKAVDYSLYYVTDRAMTPPGYPAGVTMVQLREKTASTRQFLNLAKECKVITDRYRIPLLINDRMDIALAVGCGLHVGQDDFPATDARKMLGPDALIGVSVNTAEELREVLNEGVADYIGIGPVHATQTKKDHNPALGSRGTRDILALLEDSPVRSVAIGGLNETTIPNLLAQSPAFVEKTSQYRTLDGIAFVSVVAASNKPAEAVDRLSRIIKSQPRYSAISEGFSSEVSKESLVAGICSLLQKLRDTDPLIIQNITNQVVMNDTANLCLAFSSSPIMSGNPEEADDLSPVIGSLVLNMGTLNERQILGATLAGKAANRNRKPIILDPVGVGATSFRRSTISQLLSDIHMTVIKGNAGEIGAIAGLTEVQSRGVDAAGPGFKDPAQVVRGLARREKLVVAMSGVVDYVSDGHTVIAIENGHPYQGDITGSGCMATAAIACFASVSGLESPLLATVAGITAYNVAAELAGSLESVKGPNTFRSALIDACYNLKPEDVQQRARLRVL